MTMAKALLLYTDDIAAARDEIQLAGGRVAAVDGKLLAATFADGFNETTLKISSTALPASMDPLS
jgi:hypothetical protein